MMEKRNDDARKLSPVYSDSSSAHSQTTSTSEEKKSRKISQGERKPVKILQRPHRPLNAYNLFFQEERKRMIEGLPDKGRTSKSKAIKKKMGFKDMAKTVSLRWKAISPAEKERYTRLAAKEKHRYYQEMNTWYWLNNEDDDEDGENNEGSINSRDSEETSSQKNSSLLHAVSSGTSGSSQQGYMSTTSTCSSMEQYSYSKSEMIRPLPSLLPIPQERFEEQHDQQAQSQATWPLLSRMWSFNEDQDMNTFVPSSIATLSSSIQPIAMQVDHVPTPQEDGFESGNYENMQLCSKAHYLDSQQSTEETLLNGSFMNSQAHNAYRDEIADTTRLRLLASRLGHDAVNSVVELFLKGDGR